MKKYKDLNCILLIDDDESTNFLNKLLIKNTGVDVHVQTALNGLRALEYLTASHYSENKNPCSVPDLIFLDINMPRMNGWEFLEEYNKLNDVNRAKIVIALLTSSSNADDIYTAREQFHLGEYIYKPLTEEKLVQIFSKYFSISA
jgi:CheY-like chemotaxis protein